MIFAVLLYFDKYSSMKLRNASLFTVLAILGFIFSGCFKWAARAKDKLPKETALDKTYKYEGKVIIIGAGAAGLAAGKILEQNNIDYIILEATDRYGGRLKKDTTLADFPIDIGAEWIHSDPVVLNVLKGKVGNKVEEELIPYHLENGYNWDGKVYKKQPDWELNTFYNFMPESKFKHSTWYDFVNENMAEEVKHKIKYNSVVTEINYSGGQVLVKTKDEAVYKGDKVLVTVSIGVLKSKSIKFVPDLREQKKHAIAAIDFFPGFKLAMKFKEKFYPDVINCKVKTGEKGYYDIAFKKEAKTNILGLLVTGNAAEEYYKMEGEEAIVAAAINELDKIFNGKASETFSGKYVLENWGTHKFTRGTWTQAFQAKKAHLKTLNQSLDKKVYFAGEINDTYKQMGVPGAILSGYHSIDRLLTDKK